MTGLIANLPYNGVVTINRVVLKKRYTVDVAKSGWRCWAKP
jgi:hypothetical protein